MRSGTASLSILYGKHRVYHCHFDCSPRITNNLPHNTSKRSAPMVRATAKYRLLGALMGCIGKREPTTMRGESTTVSALVSYDKNYPVTTELTCTLSASIVVSTGTSGGGLPYCISRRLFSRR